MPKSQNRLLTTLSALGLIAGSAAAVIAPVAYSAVEGAELSAEIAADLQAKVAFIQAYPQSAVAQTLLGSLVGLLAGLDPVTRAAALEQITSWGGIPSNVPGLPDTPFAALDVASAFDAIASASASTGTVASNPTGPVSIY